MRKKFLSVLLSLAMLLSLLPAPALAATVGLPNPTNGVIILKKGEYTVTSPQETAYPIEVSDTNVTLNITSSLAVNVPITVKGGGGLAILGSGNITAAEGFASDCIIKNEGMMSIGGSVTIKGAATDGSVVANEGTLYIGGDATIQGSSENRYVVNNWGVMEIQGAAKINGSAETLACIITGESDLSKLTVLGGTVKGGVTGIAVCSGELNTITGGTISGNTGITVSGGVLTVGSSAEIQGNTQGAEVVGGELIVSGGEISGNTTGIAASGGGLTISGGKISGQNALDFSGSGTIKAAVTGGTFEGVITASNANPEKFITGGTFSHNSAERYLDGKELSELVDGFYHVIQAGTTDPNNTSNVAQVVEKTKYYSTVEAAVAAAAPGNTVKLVAYRGVDTTGELSIKKELTLELNGFPLVTNIPITVGRGGALTIKGSGGDRDSVTNDPKVSSDPRTIIVEDGGSLTVEDATISNQSSSGNIVAAAIVIKGSESKVTINSGSVRAEGSNGAGVMIEDGRLAMPKTGAGGVVTATGAGGIGVWVGGGVFTAEEGAITATAERGCAIYQPKNGTTNVSDCEITGVIGVAVRDGNVSVNNCVIQTVEYEGSGDDRISVGSSADRFRPAGVVFDQSDGMYAEIKITGGKILANGDFAIRYAKMGTYYYENGDDDVELKSTDGRIRVEGNGTYTGLFSSSVSPFVNSAYKFEADSNGYSYYTLLNDAVVAVKDSGIDGTVNSLGKESPVYNVRLYLDKLSNNTLSTPFGTLFKQGNEAYYVDANTKEKKNVGANGSDWPAEPAERVGYSFGGWYTRSDDTQIVWTGGNSTTVMSLDDFLTKQGQTTDISLCARWNKDGEFRVDRVNGTAYPTLAAALEKAANGVYIYTVDGDVALTQGIPAEINKNVYVTGLDHDFVLNLNRNQLNFTGAAGLVIGSNRSTVTVINGTIESEGTAMTVNEGGRVHVTGSDVTITSAGTGVKLQGGELTVQSSAKITGTTNGIEVASGTLTVEGGEISGGNALNFGGGTGKITGGTFTGTGSDGKSVVVSGSSPTGFISGGTFLNADGKMDPLPENYLDTTAIQLDTGVVVPKEGYVVIEFDPNNGAFGEGAEKVTKTAAKGSTLSQVQPSNPTYDGHVFLGWYKEESGGEKLSTTYKFTEDATLYAHWGYPITFDARPGGFKDGAYAITADTGEDGKLGKLPDDPTHEKYTFAGWYVVGGDTEVADLVYYPFTKDTTVYAHWGYKITFDANGGTLDGDKTAVTNEDGELPEGKHPSEPIRNGFVFDGWYTVGVDTKLDFHVYQFTEDTTVTAHWTKDPNSPVYVITFDATPGIFTGGSHTATRDTDEYSILKDTDLPKATLSGYDFDYWYEVDEDTEVDFPHKFTGNTTLYAHWTKNEDPVYTITFDTNGGELTGDKTATTNSEGKLSELPKPTRDGYTFVGWYTEKENGEEVTTDYKFSKDTTVYAHWTKKPDSSDPGGEDSGNILLSYSISIASSSHGNVVTSSMSAKSGSTVTLTVNPDTDYELSSISVRTAGGTSVKTSGSGSRYSFTMPTADVTVYATFTLRPEYSFVPPQQTQSPSQPQTNTHTSLPASAFTSPTWRPSATMKDVPTSSWAYPAAQWAYQNGYLDTAADGTFRLNDTVSHMQLWKIMARWLGESALDDNSVTQWARKSGASRIGASSGVMTRQDMVEYLYQCYFLMGGDVSVSGNLIQYRDGQQVTSGSARNAWLWAVNKGIINGSTDGYLNPNKVLTRAEFASILMRLCQNG